MIRPAGIWSTAQAVFAWLTTGLYVPPKLPELAPPEVDPGELACWPPGFDPARAARAQRKVAGLKLNREVLGRHVAACTALPGAGGTINPMVDDDRGGRYLVREGGHAFRVGMPYDEILAWRAQRRPSAQTPAAPAPAQLPASVAPDAPAPQRRARKARS